jgi:hypothetical protein
MSAIEGFVPKEVIQTFRAYLDFYYLVRRNVLDDDDLIKIQDALNRFHVARTVFQQLDVRPDGFSLPRQHSMKHYVTHIQNFGAPNGLCSSITESAHIRFVKRPWRRSSRNDPMEEMLLINERIDKLAAARTDFVQRGMSLVDHRRRADHGPIIGVPNETENGPVDGPTSNGVTALAQTAGKLHPQFCVSQKLSGLQTRSTLHSTHSALFSGKRISLSSFGSICTTTAIRRPQHIHTNSRSTNVRSLATTSLASKHTNPRHHSSMLRVISAALEGCSTKSYGQ